MLTREGYTRPQILTYFSPNDLLRFIRVSRRWRVTLLSPASRSVWKYTISNAPEARRLPPCLPGMSDAAYVHLMFENVCSVRCRVISLDIRVLILYCSSAAWVTRTSFSSRFGSGAARCATKRPICA
jgi:hypothetical protein